MSLLSLLYTEKWTRAHTEPQRQVQTAAGVMRRRMQVRPQPGRHLSILASAGQRQPCDRQASFRRLPEATELHRPSAHRRPLP